VLKLYENCAFPFDHAAWPDFHRFFPWSLVLMVPKKLAADTAIALTATLASHLLPQVRGCSDRRMFLRFVAEALLL
ncbi:MAG: hypothetical protein ACREQN_08400, partial [Candidatus Binataceae bacterium]